MARKKSNKKTEPLNKEFRIERIKTNIPGFDKLTEGGFVKKSVNLLSGGPGTGKTLFALQFLYESAKNNERGLFITFEENLESLKGDAEVMGWNFSDMEKKGDVTFIAFKPIGNPNVKAELVSKIQSYGITRVVVDSISVFSAIFKGDYYRMRNELYLLVDIFRNLGCTVLLTAEIIGEAPLDVTSGGISLSRDGIVEFIADSVITLHNSGIGGEGDRAIRILKMRRTNHQKGPVPMVISRRGVKVFSAKAF
jgi:circadian clock protein KaiC